MPMPRSSCWWRSLPPLALLLGGALGGLVQPVALLCGVLFVAWIAARPCVAPRAWLPVTLVMAVLFAAHLVPGFVALPLGPPQHLGGSQPWQLRLALEKALVALALLLAWWGTPVGPWRVRPLLATVGLTLGGVPGLALALGVLGWQPKWPEGLLAWLAINLLVTCLAEELVFRAFLQRRLSERLGMPTGLLLTSLLFGLAHLPAGAGFALLAGLAGVGYGLAFHCSGNRLWPALLLHGALNTLHLLLLTYPLR